MSVDHNVARGSRHHRLMPFQVNILFVHLCCMNTSQTIFPFLELTEVPLQLCEKT